MPLDSSNQVNTVNYSDTSVRVHDITTSEPTHAPAQNEPVNQHENSENALHITVNNTPAVERPQHPSPTMGQSPSIILSGSFDELKEKGLEFYTENRMDSAEIYLSQALDKNPRDDEVKLTLDLARAEIEKIVNKITPLIENGDAALAQAEFEQAWKFYQEAIIPAYLFPGLKEKISEAYTKMVKQWISEAGKNMIPVNGGQTDIEGQLVDQFLL